MRVDFSVAGEALARGDARYVGMIGSKTKRATFENWMRQQDHLDVDAGSLVCPIGEAGRRGGRKGDKRPAVIAAMVAAELAALLDPDAEAPLD